MSRVCDGQHNTDCRVIPCDKSDRIPNLYVIGLVVIATVYTSANTIATYPRVLLTALPLKNVHRPRCFDGKYNICCTYTCRPVMNSGMTSAIIYQAMSYCQKTGCELIYLGSQLVSRLLAISVVFSWVGS